MRSVADQVREAQRRELLALTPGARAERALAAGRLALEAFASAQGLTIGQARMELRRRKVSGRRPSGCMAP